MLDFINIDGGNKGTLQDVLRYYLLLKNFVIFRNFITALAVVLFFLYVDDSLQDIYKYWIVQKIDSILLKFIVLITTLSTIITISGRLSFEFLYDIKTDTISDINDRISKGVTEDVGVQDIIASCKKVEYWADPLSDLKDLIIFLVSLILFCWALLIL